MNFFTNIWSRFRSFLLPPATVERIFDQSPVVSKTMEQNIRLWYAMFINEPPWKTRDIRPLGLPGAICREIVRPTLSELTVSVTGSARADFLAECFRDAQKKFAAPLELGLALGGLTFKPYVYNGRILIDATSAAAFQPTKFDAAGVCIGGAFRSKPIKYAGDWYVKLEAHELTGTTYTVTNKAYRSDEGGSVGQEVDITSIPAWAEIPPVTTINNLTGPLFAYFSVPSANSVDTNSDVGMSVYGGSTVELIKQADEQWERLKWEYRSSERKVMFNGTTATAAMFDKRLFEVGDFTGSDDFFEHIEPTIRDTEIYRGLQDILKQIEFQVGFTYGTISDPQTVEKTATEITNSRQRFFHLVSTVQTELESVFDRLIYAIDAYATLYNLAPAGEYETAYDWGDSILDDADAKERERANDRQDMAANILNPWEYRAKWYKEDEETAKAMLPKLQDMVDEQEEEIE